MKNTNFLAVLIGSISFVIAGCGADNSQPTTETSESSTESSSEQSTNDPSLPTYTIAIERNYPPFVEPNDQGQTGGFDIELIKAIGEKSKFNVNVEVISWPTAFEGLQAGKYQILGSGVGITPARQELSDFSDIYETSHVAFATTSPDLKSAADMNGKKIAVQPGTYYYDKIKEQYGETNEILEFESLYLSCQQLILGKVDACVDDINLLTYFQYSFKDEPSFSTFHTFTAIEGDTKEIAFAVEKGNTELVTKINEGLNQIKADGSFDKIHTQWFGK